MKQQTAPEWIHPKKMAWITDYANMSNEQRDKSFQAYEYNSAKQLYELKKPELLDEIIIKKLNAWE